MNQREMITSCNKYVDASMCETICAIDGVESSNVNVFQLNLMLNTWIGMGIDMQFPFWHETIVELLGVKGLTGTVKACEDAFLALVTRGQYSHGGELFSNACNFIQGVPGTNAVVLERMRNVSTLLRYAKRFTYDTDTANAACFKKFVEANRSCFSWRDCRCQPMFELKQKVKDGKPVYKEYETFLTSPNHSDPYFTLEWFNGKPAPKGSYPNWYHKLWRAYEQAKDRDATGFAVKLDPVLVPEYDVCKRVEPSVSEGTTLPMGFTILTKIKERVIDMLGDHPVVPLDSFAGIFSSGSAVSFVKDKKSAQLQVKSVRLRADKVKALYEYDPRWIHEDEGYFITMPAAFTKGWREEYSKAEALGSSMIAVPKSMKERRLIKPEPVSRAYYASKVRELLQTQMIYTGGYNFLPWDDQMINQGLARLGSAKMGYSSIDASAASDHQSRDLTFMLMPEWLRPYLYNAISDYVKVDGIRYRVKCFSTSGNQLTWLILGIVMWAVADYGASWYTDQDGQQLHAFAYGDDLIVPDVAYDTVVELLELFGFVINHDKSYTGDCDYRESCGGDFFSGYDITPRYWRRGIVDLNNYPDTIAFVCGLQHKLYEFPTVRNYLRFVARRLDPKITASPVGVDCDDLWDGNISFEESEKLAHRVLTSHTAADVMYPQSLQDHQYFCFLKFGRKFASNEDRRHGISIPYLSPNLVVEPTQRWVLKTPPYSHKEDK